MKRTTTATAAILFTGCCLLAHSCEKTEARNYTQALEIVPASVTIAHGDSVSLKAYLNTYVKYDGCTELGEPISTVDVTNRCKWSLSDSKVLKEAPGNAYTTGSRPGKCSVYATHGDCKTQSEITVSDWNSDINVRNLKATIAYDNGKTEDLHLEARETEIQFLCDWSFEYQICYASGTLSEWHPSTRGPLTRDELEMAYGLTSGGYISNLEPADASVELIQSGDEMGDFHVIFKPNTDDRERTCKAGFRVSVGGQADSMEISVTQDADSYTTEYRNLSIEFTVGSDTAIHAPASACSFEATWSVSVWYHDTWASGTVTDWMTMKCPAAKTKWFTPSTFITLNGKDIELKENTTGVQRTGHVKIWCDLYGLHAEKVMQVIQEAQ